MPRYLVTYDLKNTTPSPYSTFIQKASDLGWHRWIKGDSGKSYMVPNTTLVGEFDSIGAAETAFYATRDATSRAIGIAVTIEKFIITERGQSKLRSDVTDP